MLSTEAVKDQFSGNGVTTSFTITKKLFLDSSGDVEVTAVKTDTSDNDTTLTLGSHFTVVANADQETNPGGTMTYPVSGSALASGETLTVITDPAYTQLTDLIRQGRWNPDVVEQMVDRAVTNAAVNNSAALRLPVSDPAARSVTIPNAGTRASKYLSFDSNGDPTVSALTTTGAATAMDPTSADTTRDKLVSNDDGNWLYGKKGADMASAATMDLDNMTGNYAHVTGTTGITAFSNVTAGRVYTFVFDGAVLLTHHATNFILPGGANITTAAGDTLQIRGETTGQVRAVFFQKADGGVVKSLVNADISSSAAIATTKLGAGAVVQVVSNTYASFDSTTTAMPHDNTIPQNTEGDEFMTVTITPTNASNILYFHAVGMFAHSTADYFTMALFQDSTANAIAVSSDSVSVSNEQLTMTMGFSIVAGTTSSTTFKIRAGGNTGSTTSFNGSSGTVMFSTAPKSFFSVMEVAV